MPQAQTTDERTKRCPARAALSAAFVPVFIEARKRDGDSRAWLLARRLITLIGSFLALLFVVPESARAPEERIAAVAWALLIAGAVQLINMPASILGTPSSSSACEWDDHGKTMHHIFPEYNP